MKNERGITLIILVTTVVILSILTGVTLNMALLENDSIIDEVDKETKKQNEMIKEEENKRSNVIEKLEDEWGIS